MADGPPRDVEFVRLFSQNARRLYAYIFMLVANQTDADDVFQETSRVLWEKFAEFELGTSFPAWAEKTAHFQTLKLWKRKGRDRHQFSEGFLDAVVEQRNNDADGLDQRQKALDECIEKLSSKDQEMLRLRYREGATTKSVADQVGRTVAALYKALNRIETVLVDCTQRALHRDDSPPVHQG